MSENSVRYNDVLKAKVAERIRPEPPEEYFEEYFDRLVERIEEEDRTKALSGGTIRVSERISGLLGAISAAIRPPRWAMQFGIAVILVGVGVLLGQSNLFQVIPSSQNGAKQSIEMARATASALQYLERSKTLLIGLVNYDPEHDGSGMLNVPRQKKMALNLVTEATEIRTALNHPDQQRLRRLIADLEVILIQIANLDPESDVVEMETIKSGVDRKALLFKINVEEMLRPEGNTSRNTQGSKRS